MNDSVRQERQGLNKEDRRFRRKKRILWPYSIEIESPCLYSCTSCPLCRYWNYIFIIVD
jgi:hypothetical protein